MEFSGISGGAWMSVIAFSIVFLVCIGLMGLMMGLKHFANAINKFNESRATPGAKSAPAAGSPAPALVATAPDMGEEEIVAVITAAIAASCGAGARITSITPAPARTPSSAWRMTGRLQNCEGFGD